MVHRKTGFSVEEVSQRHAGARAWRGFEGGAPCTAALAVFSNALELGRRLDALVVAAVSEGGQGGDRERGATAVYPMSMVVGPPEGKRIGEVPLFLSWLVCFGAMAAIQAIVGTAVFGGSLLLTALSIPPSSTTSALFNTTYFIVVLFLCVGGGKLMARTKIGRRLTQMNVLIGGGAFSIAAILLAPAHLYLPAVILEHAIRVFLFLGGMLEERLRPAPVRWDPE